MIEQFEKLFKIPDLRKRLVYTLLMLAIYRIGAHIPLPGVDPRALNEFMNDLRLQGGTGSAMDYLDMFSGGALSQMAIFAMGIMPYISASIILQLLTVVVPTLERLSKEGEVGRRKITTYTRYLTGVIAAVQASGIAWWLTSAQAQTMGGAPLVPDTGPLFYCMCVLTLTTGTVFIMWVGEQITERGISNGISLLIFASIVVRLGPAVGQTYARVQEDRLSPFQAIILLVVMVAVVAFIVFVERAQRRIPVQYAKRVVGRQVRAGQSTHLPLKLNTSGVIPVIFAQSVVVLPGMLLNLPFFQGVPWAERMANQLHYAMPLYVLLELTAIIFFCFFYTSIVFNPVDTTDNIKKYGGFIPGIRPGKKTAEYIDRILSRLTLVGAVYVAAVCVLPVFLATWANVTFFFGGTALLIVVGVALDTIGQVESHLVSRQYEGFVSGARQRGRLGR